MIPRYTHPEMGRIWSDQRRYETWLLVETAAADELYERPLHPYTQVLLNNALPSHPDDVREEVILRGEVPSAFDSDGGPFWATIGWQLVRNVL